MNTLKQKYSIYRDGTLIASEVSSLSLTGSAARKDARREHAQGRTASYTISGSLGFKCRGAHIKGKLRWEDGKLHLGSSTEVLV